MSLIIRNLSYFYEDKEKLILDNVNLEISGPGIFSIEGENGSGKTTFMKILATILEAPSSNILLNNEKIGSENYKKKMGYIPDTPILFEDLTGEEHIDVFSDLWEMDKREKIKYRNSIYEFSKLFKLTDYLKQKVKTYSLGTRYKLFYLLTICRDVDLLLMDEPFSSLDYESQNIARSILNEYGENAIIIVSSHQKEFVESISQTNFFLKDKHIIKKSRQ